MVTNGRKWLCRAVCYVTNLLQSVTIFQKNQKSFIKVLTNKAFYVIIYPQQRTTPPQRKGVYIMKVTTYCINKGQKTQYFGLKAVESNQVLYYAPNNWKTEKGAINWAKKHGYTV